MDKLVLPLGFRLGYSKVCRDFVLFVVIESQSLQLQTDAVATRNANTNLIEFPLKTVSLCCLRSDLKVVSQFHCIDCSAFILRVEKCN